MSMPSLASPAVGALPDVNLYTSAPFLAVVAQVYFPGQTCSVKDHVVDGQVYRLLHVPGQGPLQTQTFLDLHEPLGLAAKGKTRPLSLPCLMAAVDLVPIDRHMTRPDWAEHEAAPTVRWSAFPTWADYERQVLIHHSDSEDRRRRRRLDEQLGPLRFQVDDVQADVLTTCMAWKSHRDTTLGRADLFANAAHRHFFEAMRKAALLRASTLRAADGELLAIWLGAVHRQRWSGWVFTFNPNPVYSRYTLGRQLLHHMLQESHREGHVEFDFSIGMEPYKLNYATHVRPIGLVGRAPVRTQAKVAVRHWLQRNPWCLEQIQRLRHWLAPAGTPT
jgi:hypothetical protein